MGDCRSILINWVRRCNNIEANYAMFLNNRPLTVMVLTSFISVTLSSLALAISDLPTFLIPKLGFETVGTEFSQRITTYRNIERQTSEYEEWSKLFFRSFATSKTASQATDNVSRTAVGSRLYSTSNHDRVENCADRRVDTAVKVKSQLVLKYTSAEALLQVESFEELSKFQKEIQSILEEDMINLIEPRGTVLSLMSSVSCWFNKSSDEESITHDDLLMIRQLLKECSRFENEIFLCRTTYRRSSTAPTDAKCDLIPTHCRSDIIFELFNYFLSNNVPSNVNSNTAQPVYILLVLPIKRYEILTEVAGEGENATLFTEFLSVVHKIVKSGSKLRQAKLDGKRFSLETETFAMDLSLDIKLLIIGLIVVCLIIWLYSCSLFYTLAVIFTMAYSLGVAYFLYKFVFRITFFPFINLLVFVLLIGIGADDTFVLCHVYYIYHRKRAQPSEHASAVPGPVRHPGDIVDAFSNAALSMFITSATTAAAFFANYISKIIVIKCFSIFAGCVMLTNYLLVVTWLPACLTVYDYYVEPYYNRICNKSCLRLADNLAYNCLFTPRVLLLERFIPWLIRKLRKLFVPLFALTFVASSFFLLQNVAIALPERNFFSGFRRHGLMAWYDEYMVDNFRFMHETDNQFIEVILTWGFKPAATGSSALNPHKTPTELIYDDLFDFNLKTVFDIDKICRQLNQGKNTMNNGCFTTAFLRWSTSLNCSTIQPVALNAPSNAINTGQTMDFCCNVKNKAFDHSTISLCAAEATKILDRSTYRGGPIFRRLAYDVQGFTMFFDQPVDLPFKHTQFFEQLDVRMDRILAKYENSILGRGWYVTAELDIMKIRDLQASLLYDTPIAILIALAIALVIIVLLTRNIWMGVFSVITVLSVISVTLACLMLLKWQLNVVESTIAVLAVGLSFDFASHYVVAYQLAPDESTEQQIVATLTYAGVPVLLSALTTLLAGCAVLPSFTTAFYETGVFLISNSIINWLISTFFLLSLLSLWGPKQGVPMCKKLIKFVTQIRLKLFKVFLFKNRTNMNNPVEEIQPNTGNSVINGAS